MIKNVHLVRTARTVHKIARVGANLVAMRVQGRVHSALPEEAVPNVSKVVRLVCGESSAPIAATVKALRNAVIWMGHANVTMDTVENGARKNVLRGSGV